MKRFLLILLFSFEAFANVNPPPGQYDITAMLSLRQGSAILYVNPMSRNAYQMDVKNIDVVVRQLRTPQYFGPVHVVVNLFNPDASGADVVVEKIGFASEAKPLPVYDGAFKIVK